MTESILNIVHFVPIQNMGDCLLKELIGYISMDVKKRVAVSIRYLLLWRSVTSKSQMLSQEELHSEAFQELLSKQEKEFKQ